MPEGVDYKSADGIPSNLLFMIAAPDGGANTHIELLSKLMTMLMNPSFARKLTEAETPGEFIALIDREERKKDETDAVDTAAAREIQH